MEWYQFLMLAIGLYAMHRETQKKIDEFKTDMAHEIKDFHGRLCALEEKYIQMMERFMEKK